MNIERLHISGFKSIAGLALEDLTPFSVLAGPNGSGKSNWMDALAFVSAVVELGAIKALRQFRGFSQVHCYKLRKANARTFSFELQASIRQRRVAYTLKVHDMDSEPKVEELLVVDDRKLLERKKAAIRSSSLQTGTRVASWPSRSFRPTCRVCCSRKASSTCTAS